MADPVQLLGPDGAPAAGRSFSAAEGIRLRVTLPAGRRLAEARLSLASADAAEQAVLYPPLQTDAGTADGQTEASWRWAAIDWRHERALTGVIIDARDASTPPRTCAARVKLYSRGHWLPLTPLDALPTGAVQRFPPLAASRLMAEMLVEGDVGGSRSGVPIPGALTGKRIGAILTGQACHVSLAMEDLPPFFAPEGPLPTQAQPVEGLTRILNRYLSDHPGTTEIPLLLRAAGDEAVRVGPFAATLEVPAPADDAAAPPADPHQARPGEQPWFPPGRAPLQAARLIDPQHQAAQSFAPLPADRSLSSTALRLRPLADAFVGNVRLHALRGDQTVEPPLAEWPLSFGPDSAQAADAVWLRFRLPETVAPAGPWRLTCQATSGALLWYVDDSPRPAPLQSGLARTGQGPWLPLDGPGEAPWLQVEVGLLDTAP